MVTIDQNLKAVFLDRDGTLNRAILRGGLPFSAKNVDEVELLPGVTTAVDMFKEMNYMPIIITNQPDVARGFITQRASEEINYLIQEKLKINHSYICFHDDSDNCICRKPKAGLIIQASKELNIDLSRSIMVGDRWKDIMAGQAAGCTSYYIDKEYKEQKPQQPFTVVESLLHAAQIVWNKHVI